MAHVLKFFSSQSWLKNYKSGTTVASRGAGPAYTSGAPLVHSRFLVGFVLLDLWFYVYVLWIVVCPSLICDSDYPFGVIKLFLETTQCKYLKFIHI
jgi:hypothetical protein